MVLNGSLSNMAKAWCKVLTDTQCLFDWESHSEQSIPSVTCKVWWKRVVNFLDTTVGWIWWALLLLFSEFVTRTADFTNEDICEFMLWTCFFGTNSKANMFIRYVHQSRCAKKLYWNLYSFHVLQLLECSFHQEMKIVKNFALELKFLVSLLLFAYVSYQIFSHFIKLKRQHLVTFKTLTWLLSVFGWLYVLSPR